MQGKLAHVGKIWSDVEMTVQYDARGNASTSKITALIKWSPLLWVNGSSTPMGLAKVLNSWRLEVVLFGTTMELGCMVLQAIWVRVIPLRQSYGSLVWPLACFEQGLQGPDVGG